MIESGKRTPSGELLELLAAVFQRAPAWFLDESADFELPAPAPGGAAAPVPLEPAFLFSRSLLQVAIPELLAQTGTSGRQFANLLIRSHQEISRNDFPDLERAADEVSERRFPLSAEDLVRLCRRHGQRSAGSTASRCWRATRDRKSTRLNSSHSQISYAVFC